MRNSRNEAKLIFTFPVPFEAVKWNEMRGQRSVLFISQKTTPAATYCFPETIELTVFTKFSYDLLQSHVQQGYFNFTMLA